MGRIEPDPSRRKKKKDSVREMPMPTVASSEMAAKDGFEVPKQQMMIHGRDNEHRARRTGTGFAPVLTSHVRK
jgi:hypothetical protein